MKLIDDIVSQLPTLTAWRHDIHAHPELAFNETRTADFVAQQLESWGIGVSRGVGKTGVVGTLKVGHSGRSIGLRADMDALPMQELNTFAHKSKHPGCMHGCGHDGHTVTLLAAAQYLAKSRNFDGTVQFIFQPAEEANEWGSGAKSMIDDGLLERFPIDSVFALHNGAQMPIGKVLVSPGPFMAAMDQFEVKVTGKGTHAAMPHTGIDPLLIAAQLLTAWQSIVSRNVDPQQSAVISATSLQSGNSWNVIPDSVTLRGSIRTLNKATQARIKKQFFALTEQISAAFGGEAEIQYYESMPLLQNDPQQTSVLVELAKQTLGQDGVDAQAPPVMGSEDFAYFSQKIPGCYFLLGNGDGEGSCMVHEPTYDFSDEIIPIGATLFARLVEHQLAT